MGVILTLAGQAKFAAAASDGGAPVLLHEFAVGDGNGSPITPLETMTSLVHEVDRVDVQSAVVDPVQLNWLVVTAILDGTAGPYTIREIGIYDNTGTLIAISDYPATLKAVAAMGVDTTIEIRTILVVSETANVAVTLNMEGYATREWVMNRKIPIGQLGTTPFLPVKSFTTTAPPGSPAIGDLYAVPAGATGAWAGQAQKLAEWTVGASGNGWVFLTTPNAHLISTPDGKFYKKVSGSYGEISLELVASEAEHLAGASTSKWTNPAGVAKMISAAVDRERDPTSFTDVQPTFDIDLTNIKGAPFSGNLLRATNGGHRLNAKGIYVPTGIDEPVIDYGADGKAVGTGFYGAYTNILLNSAALSTQTVAVSALTYTLSFRGTGSVTLSGAATGVLAGVEANSRVSLTFAASAGTLTVTVAGGVVEASLTATAFPVPYIATTSAAVVRNADSMVIGGSDFTDFFNPSEGTIFADITAIADISWAIQITRGAGTWGPRVQLAYSAPNVIASTVNDLGVPDEIYFASPKTVRAAYAFKSGGSGALSLNGLPVELSSGGQMATGLAALEIGRAPAGGDGNCMIRRLIYWPRAIDATLLQRMTA